MSIHKVLTQFIIVPTILKSNGTGLASDKQHRTVAVCNILQFLLLTSNRWMNEQVLIINILFIRSNHIVSSINWFVKFKFPQMAWLSLMRLQTCISIVAVVVDIEDCWQTNKQYFEIPHFSILFIPFSFFFLFLFFQSISCLTL